jgi:hypothetical protein
MEEIYTAYERFATDAHRELASTYGLVVFGDPLGSGYADDPGISGMIGALENGSWENLFLDDYQVELLKARAVRGYWEKELEIAQAVYDYSVDTSSGRPTQAETRAFYERSLREYEAALVRYNSAVDSLESIKTALAGNQQQLAALMDHLNELKADLQEAEQVYRDYYLAYRLDSQQYQQEEFRRYYERPGPQGLSPTEAHNQESLAVRLADFHAPPGPTKPKRTWPLVSKELTRLIDGNYDLEDATPTFPGDPAEDLRRPGRVAGVPLAKRAPCSSLPCGREGCTCPARMRPIKSWRTCTWGSNPWPTRAKATRTCFWRGCVRSSIP